MSHTTYCHETGKIRHASRTSAREAMNGIRKKRNLRLRESLGVYVCRKCGGFHVGNSPGRVER